MLKWVVGLCAAMYLVLITYGEPTSEELAARELRDSQQVTRLETTPVSTPKVQETVDPEAVETDVEQVITSVAATTTVIEAPALVSASTESTAPATVTPVETASIVNDVSEPEPETQLTNVAATTSNEIWRVTARAVNLRAGPSTNNAVVGRATQNDSAEIIELLPSGWAKVYILETGTEAFISAQFLAAPE